MADQRELRIEHPGVGEESLLVTSVGTDQYRLDESSLLCDAVFGDVIEAEAVGEERVRFKGIVQRSELVTTECLLPKSVHESDGLQPLLDKVMELGGNWEQIFGGLLIVHLPREADLDVEAEIRSLAQ